MHDDDDYLERLVTGCLVWVGILSVCLGLWLLVITAARWVF